MCKYSSDSYCRYITSKYTINYTQVLIFSFPMQFCFNLIFISIGFALLIIGILCGANIYGYTAAIWFILSYVFQSIGELFIGPTGYVVVDKLTKPKLQGLMMISWMVVTGSTSGVIASLLLI